MEMQRGYAWADIRIGATPVRFVTTHLEAFWKAGAVAGIGGAGAPARRAISPT